MKALLFFFILGTLGSHSYAADSCEKVIKQEQKNLKEFDDLDFRVFSNQKWDDFKLTHSKDIVVHFPDGHTTTGLKKHIEDMKAMFVALPDLKISEHPIKIADKNFTAVQGIMEGTFTKPMTLPDGKVVQPNGKKLKLEMVTIGKWKDGVMTEEFLYWDNAAYMAQLGIQ